MATTPTDGPTMETSDDVVSDVSMVPRCFRGGDDVVSRNFKVTRGFGGIVENAKVNVGKLYLRQILKGPDTNQSVVLPATGLGTTGVNNWAVYDSDDSEANLVAKGQGMHTYAGSWYNWFTLVFEVKRFKGSTLEVMGASVGKENEWAIVGGTGEFAMARGIIKRREYYVEPGTKLTQELTMEFFCRMTVVPAPIKRGTVGGDTGSLWEMKGKSQRLEKVTISHHGAVEGFQFSYIDENGQSRTAGTWGKRSPVPTNNTEIKFGPSEFVKQINGARRGGEGWLSKFEIVTTHETYGPFGFDNGHPSFSYTVPEGETVVGFFAKTDYTYVTTIGVYTI